MKTKYRFLKYEGAKYLQYLKTYKFLFFKWKRWVSIPYYKSGVTISISDKIPEFKNLKKFIMTYPDVNVYLKLYNERKNKKNNRK